MYAKGGRYSISVLLVMPLVAAAFGCAAVPCHRPSRIHAKHAFSLTHASQIVSTPAHARRRSTGRTHCRGQDTFASTTLTRDLRKRFATVKAHSRGTMFAGVRRDQDTSERKGVTTRRMSAGGSPRSCEDIFARRHNAQQHRISNTRAMNRAQKQPAHAQQRPALLQKLESVLQPHELVRGCSPPRATIGL